MCQWAQSIYLHSLCNISIVTHYYTLNPLWYGIHMDKTESYNYNHHKHRSNLLIELVSHILTPLCGPSTWKDSQGASWSTTRPAPSLGFSTRTIPHPCRYIRKSTCSQTTHVHICVKQIIVGSKAAQKWLSSVVNCGSMFWLLKIYIRNGNVGIRE